MNLKSNMEKRLYFRFYPGLFTYKPILSGSIVLFTGYERQTIDVGDRTDGFNSSIEKILEKFKDTYGLSLFEFETPVLFFHSMEHNFKTFNEKLNSHESILFFIGNADGFIDFSTDNYTIEFESTEKAYLYHNNTLLYNVKDSSYHLELFTYEFRDSKFNIDLREVLSKRVKMVESDPTKKAIEEDYVLRSLNWYNKACNMIRSKDEHSAIILFSIAFESFFNLSRPSKKDAFCYAIGRYLGSDGIIMRWASDFYQARNVITHSGELSEESVFTKPDRHIEHSKVAKFVFEECIYTQLLLTDGLEFPIENREWSHNFITQKLLKSNIEIVEEILNNNKFNLTALIKSPDIGKELFSLIDSIKIYEKPIGRKTGESRTMYLKTIELIRGIVLEWVDDVLANHIDDLVDKSDLFSATKKDIIERLKAMRDIINDKNRKYSKQIFDQWLIAEKVVSRIWQHRLPNFAFPDSRKTIKDLIVFVRKSSILADE